ncbi:hypothetical protein J6590_079265 [Homalodisca vitripennis]|nr:hypothetical protein J6590_079265 [Homalodisca vitripennis]
MSAQLSISLPPTGHSFPPTPSWDFLKVRSWLHFSFIFGIMEHPDHVLLFLVLRSWCASTTSFMLIPPIFQARASVWMGSSRYFHLAIIGQCAKLLSHLDTAYQIYRRGPFEIPTRL